jgi:ABC-type branched-subunit amino acid transport system substrate-binding protein
LATVPGVFSGSRSKAIALSRPYLRIAAVAALTALAACSSTAGTRRPTAPTAAAATAAPSTTGTGTTTGVTATAIHVGALVYSAFYSGGVTGALARFKRQNDAGGVYGRKIVMDDVADDLSDQSHDVAAAQKLVEEDHVFAVVPVLTQTLGAAPFLEQAKVPFFGWSIQPIWCNNPYAFGFEGNDCDQTQAKTVADTAAVEQRLFPDGTAKGKTIALESTDADSARLALKGFAADWEAHGATVVLQDTTIPAPPAVVGDYTPYAERLLTSDNGRPPDLIVVVLAVAGSAGLNAKLQQLGYHGIVQGFSLYDPRIAKIANGFVNLVQLEPFEANTPAIAQMRADVAAQSPTTQLSQPVAAGYWSADLFIAALQRAGPNLTRESLIAALNGGFHYEVAGGTPPIEFPQGHSQGSPCAAYVQGNGTGFDVKIPLTCAPVIPNPLLGRT